MRTKENLDEMGAELKNRYERFCKFLIKLIELPFQSKGALQELREELEEHKAKIAEYKWLKDSLNTSE